MNDMNATKQAEVKIQNDQLGQEKQRFFASSCESGRGLS